MAKLSERLLSVVALTCVRFDGDRNRESRGGGDNAEIAREVDVEEWVAAMRERGPFDFVEGGAGSKVSAAVREGFIEMTESEMGTTASVAALEVRAQIRVVGEGHEVCCHRSLYASRGTIRRTRQSDWGLHSTNGDETGTELA